MPAVRERRKAEQGREGDDGALAGQEGDGPGGGDAGDGELGAGEFEATPTAARRRRINLEGGPGQRPVGPDRCGSGDDAAARRSDTRPMKRLILIITAGALAAAALVGSAGAQAPTTLELVQSDREVTSGFVDAPPKRRDSAGDVFTVRGPLRDAQNRRAATAHGVFTQTGPRSAHGGATFTLPAGRIAVQGVLGLGGDDTLAIVGGTGASGSVRIVQSQGRTTFTFTF